MMWRSGGFGDSLGVGGFADGAIDSGGGATETDIWTGGPVGTIVGHSTVVDCLRSAEIGIVSLVFSAAECSVDSGTGLDDSVIAAAIYTYSDYVGGAGDTVEVPFLV